MNDEEHFKLMIRGAVERGRIAERTRIAALCTHEYPDIKTQYERLRHENFMLKHKRMLLEQRLGEAHDENRLLKDQLNEARTSLGSLRRAEAGYEPKAWVEE